MQENFNVLLCAFYCFHIQFPWAINKPIRIRPKPLMIIPIDPRVDKVEYDVVWANINILATQALFVMEFSPYTVKIT